VIMADPTNKGTVYTFTTADMNLVCTLLCFDGIFLKSTEAQPLPRHLKEEGRRPRCIFTLASADNAKLLGLIKQHREVRNGASVPSKRYDEVRRHVVIPAMNDAQDRLENNRE